MNKCVKCDEVKFDRQSALLELVIEEAGEHVLVEALVCKDCAKTHFKIPEEDLMDIE